MNKKIPYIIVTPGWRTYNAGVRVLHRLCHLLNTKGYESYLYTIISEGVNPAWNTPVINNDKGRLYELINKVGAIVLYPEIVLTNFLNALRPIGFVGNPQRDSPYHIKFYYDKACGMNITDDNLLTIDIVERELFNDDNIIESRTINSIWVGKGCGDKLHDLNIPNLFLITNTIPQTRKELATILRKSDLFFTFDCQTALSTEARLCGCPCIFIPNNSHTAEFYTKVTIIPDGLAGDNTLEEILRARRTLHSFKEKHINTYSKENWYIDNFIKITQGM